MTTRIGMVLLHFLWQGTLIGFLYAVARRFAAGSGARYGLACLALAAMTFTPVVTLEVMRPVDASVHNPYVGLVPASSEVAVARVAMTTPTALPAATRATRDVMPWLVTAWLAGATLLWMRLLGGWITAGRMRSKVVRSAPSEWQQRFDAIRARVGVSGPVRLLVSALVQTPMVVGWLRPVVLVPVGALAGLPAEHVEAFLAHELAHIRRHDYLVNMMQSVVEALLFYHPAVWWISGHIRSEREHCCDDIAVAITGDPIVYAVALTGFETQRPAMLHSVMAANGGVLRERIARVLGMSESVGRTPGAALFAAGALIATTAIVMFAQAPAKLTFDVVSIKPNDLGGGHTHSNTTPTRFTGSMTTKSLIQMAFGLKSFQISGGPKWMDESNYDISATTSRQLVPGLKSREPYLQSLLADRYALKYHRETKDLPAYLLVTVKQGPRLSPHTGTRGTGTDSDGDGVKVVMFGSKLDMAGMADYLANAVSKPVIDRTGIQGEFDVNLTWASREDGSPSLFTALQEQLGLRLTADKGPVEILVVDSLEKPSEN